MNPNIQTARVLEYMPRILQYLVSLRTTNLEGASEEAIELNDLSQFTHIDVTATKGCHMPPIGILESNITINSFAPGRVAYSLNLPLIGVGPEDQVHIVAPSYLKLRDSKILYPWQSATHYTPMVLRYKVIEYDRGSNKGIAIISGPAFSLLLTEEDTRVMLEYQLQDIGAKIIPTIKESYIVR